MARQPKRPALDRSRPAVLDAATRLLLESPELSLAQLAARIGIGRTTLHRMFPTREALLAAVAHDAIDHLAVVYTDAGLEPDRGGPALHGAQEDLVAPFRQLVQMLIPLGPQLMFLLRAVELREDPDLERRIAELDEPLFRAIEQAQRDLILDPQLPAWWILESLNALVYIAWEQIENGRLAAQDATALVIRTWLCGTHEPPERSITRRSAEDQT